MTKKKVVEENNILPAKRQRFNFNWAKIGISFSTVGIVIFIYVFAFGYFQLSNVNISLAKMVGDLQKRSAANSQELALIQKSVDDFKLVAQKSEGIYEQQQQLLSEWHSAQKGDLDKWHVTEAQYLVKQANDQIQFNYDLSLAITYLHRADQVLQAVSDPAVVDLRKALADSLASIEALPKVDMTGLYAQLIALTNQIEQLPLPKEPFKPVKESSIADKSQPSTIESSETPWWKTGLARLLDALRQIVIIRNSSDALPLVMPEEKKFLYQNLHAQIETIVWALLHRNVAIYQISLGQAEGWIHQYFDQDAKLTKSMLQNLQTLQTIDIKPPITNLSTTLKLFDNYFTQTASSAKAAE